jgi:hypothetical protein
LLQQLRQNMTDFFFTAMHAYSNILNGGKYILPKNNNPFLRQS